MARIQLPLRVTRNAFALLSRSREKARYFWSPSVSFPVPSTVLLAAQYRAKKLDTLSLLNLSASVSAPVTWGPAGSLSCQPHGLALTRQ